MTGQHPLTQTGTETAAERPRTEVTPDGGRQGSSRVSPAAELEAAGLLVRWAVEIVETARLSRKGS
jgi:hypothetical protein